MIEKYGYNDPDLVNETIWNTKKKISLVISILLILGVWLVLDSKLLFGQAWISETYDRPDWYANEGELHTNGAWDIETHVWKTEYIMDNFPNFQWNPYWYLGMPVFKYYQIGYYIASIATILITGVSAARSSLLLVIFGHLIATLLTFLLCYKVSRKPLVSALCSLFLLVSTFISLRSYGWEPISVVFLFLYPLGLLIFLKNPLKPLRFSMVIVMTLAYLCHPLLFFSLCMTLGLYLFSLAIRKKEVKPGVVNKHYIWKYLLLVVFSILIGGFQFLPQSTYNQVTSGAHMGVSYLPFYHVEFNIITLKDFFFNAGNLKGPGPVVMIAFFMSILFFFYKRSDKTAKLSKKTIFSNELVAGLLLVMVSMVLFYYLEYFNIFPMNVLRSIQYHRIIPEFIVVAATLTASIYNLISNKNQKIMYYTILITFIVFSMIIVGYVRSEWRTTDNISNRPEFIYDNFSGRISFPYTDQSLSVRNSFTKVPQVYGYYEQGVTNSYADEIFSVSSGFHSKEFTLIYLKAGNVGRFYVNTQEGNNDKIMLQLLKGLPYSLSQNDTRYGYFEIPLKNPDFAQALDISDVEKIKELEPGCRTIFQDEYCGSVKEEFIESDPQEVSYLKAYIDATEKDNTAKTVFNMENPNKYVIEVKNSSTKTEILIKMTYDSDFKATIDNEEIKIEKIGPDFMVVYPNRGGDYNLTLTYPLVPKIVLRGMIVSLTSLIAISIYFWLRPKEDVKRFLLKTGDMR